MDLSPLPIYAGRGIFIEGERCKLVARLCIDRFERNLSLATGNWVGKTYVSCTEWRRKSESRLHSVQLSSNYIK
jgi:hypothetical protein